MSDGQQRRDTLRGALNQELARCAANVHLVLETDDRGPRVMPDQAVRARAARGDRLADQVADVLYRIGLCRRLRRTHRPAAAASQIAPARSRSRLGPPRLRNTGTPP